jgi:hypothetical protein
MKAAMRSLRRRFGNLGSDGFGGAKSFDANGDEMSTGFLSLFRFLNQPVL